MTRRTAPGVHTEKRWTDSSLNSPQEPLQARVAKCVAARRDFDGVLHGQSAERAAEFARHAADGLHAREPRHGKRGGGG